MNPHTLQTEALRLNSEINAARALLTLAIPYIEDASHDPAYKGAPVAELLRKMRECVQNLRQEASSSEVLSHATKGGDA